MGSHPVRIIEDDFHRLQTPGSTQGAEATPFVGNASVDDNIAECVQVALWGLGSALRHRIHASVADARVTQTGKVDSIEQVGAIESAVFAIAGIAGITNFVETAEAAVAHDDATPATPRKAVPARGSVASRPMLYVTRYCSLEAASITAAIRQGVNALDALLGELEKPAPAEAVVIYRNRLRETVTIEVGYPLAAAVAKRATGDARSGRTPGGSMLSILPSEGLAGLFTAQDQLLEQARLANLSPAKAIWQVFPLPALHHAARPIAPVYLPVSDRRYTMPAGVDNQVAV